MAGREISNAILSFLRLGRTCVIITTVPNSGVGQWPKEYVALSYVWGDREQVYAPTGEEYAALAEKGALSNLRLSTTIHDAILSVQRLGLRYLWADALCIRQHDASDKDEQIAQMGFVYQSAMFTIIAASGHDCDAGLPGVRPRTRFKEQKFVQAGDITLVSSIQYPGDKIVTAETSKWTRRAWTFQEELLSPRQLIFTDEQIWWRCSCATWCEASQLETTDTVGFFLTGQAVAPRLDQRYAKLTPDRYFDLVTNYARRQLSYPSDALNAFAGILSMLTEYSHERFLWGLMTSTFERQLYWVGKAKPRASPEHGYFPTWSWVGWEGEVSFRHYRTYNPSITCYVLQRDNNELKWVPISNSTTTSTSTTIPPNKLLPRFHILLHTTLATFYLTPQGRLTLPHLPARPSYSKTGLHLGSKPDYGYLVPSLDGPELCEKGWRECILLGKKPKESQWDVDHMVVMLVERRDDGIAYRLGMADLCREVWELAERREERIVLG
ncbi:putative heterokaryon incompatibility [Phaeomoniella chlamydospora]|uniref:Putative heterokaryon incompatibility n=1 Tax=Phaeomoniella chlamydospora TaxID=158046 RepID=A0A0G2HJB3_PHACM|nr:putative heterokaryon incompatibility [Phaeomoniella chlamydospora]